MFFHCFYQKPRLSALFGVFGNHIGPKNPAFSAKSVERRGFWPKMAKNLAIFGRRFLGRHFDDLLAATVFFTFFEKVVFF